MKLSNTLLALALLVVSLASFAGPSSTNPVVQSRELEAIVNIAKGAGSFVNGMLDYETVAASQTDQVCGNTGALGDLLDHLMIVPATTSPGAVSVKDGSGSAIPVFAGGASSVSDLRPFIADWRTTPSTNGAWKVTTGTNVSVVCFGIFTP